MASEIMSTPREKIPSTEGSEEIRTRDAAASSCCCLLFVGCLTSQQQASVSQGRISSDNCTCCHTEMEVADPTFYLTQSQYTDTGPTSPSTDPITPGAWQGSHWSANFEVTGMTRPRRKKSRRKRDSNPGSSALEADALPTRPTKRCSTQDSEPNTALLVNIQMMQKPEVTTCSSAHISNVELSGEQKHTV